MVENPAAQGASAGQGRPVEAKPQGKISAGNVFKFAGAFVAFMIGSGYASGQEILQFFTAYGLWSVGGLIIALVLFSWLGKVLMNYGYRHNELTPETMPDTSFRYYWRQVLRDVPCLVQSPCSSSSSAWVMTSGAGASAGPVLRPSTWVGALAMCVLVFVTNLFGFKRIVNIVGALGPLTIHLLHLHRHLGHRVEPRGPGPRTEHADEFATMANATNGAPLWALAGTLYVAYNMTGSVPFLTQTWRHRKLRARGQVGRAGGRILFIAAGCS